MGAFMVIVAIAIGILFLGISSRVLQQPAGRAGRHLPR